MTCLTLPPCSREDGFAALPTPAPFPQSSQIGTGLSRQNSLRRSGESGTNTSGSSPCSERGGTPGSPASPTAGHRWALVSRNFHENADAMVCSSPARFKLNCGPGAGRSGKLTAPPRSVLPILNQIHEESEEGGLSPGADGGHQSGPALPAAPPSTAVLRRLEQRRRLHKVRRPKGRTSTVFSLLPLPSNLPIININFVLHFSFLLVSYGKWEGRVQRCRLQRYAAMLSKVRTDRCHQDCPGVNSLSVRMPPTRHHLCWTWGCHVFTSGLVAVSPCVATGHPAVLSSSW